LVEKSLLLLGFAAVAVIIFAIILSISYQTQILSENSTPQSFSQIVTVGPVWNTNSWTCTSDRDFMVGGILRGMGLSEFSINVSDQGTQSLYTFLYDGQPASFSVGSKANQGITITRVGVVTGFLTLQTSSDAKASCISNPQL
jgi:hypothetical protein